MWAMKNMSMRSRSGGDILEIAKARHLQHAEARSPSNKEEPAMSTSRSLTSGDLKSVASRPTERRLSYSDAVDERLHGPAKRLLHDMRPLSLRHDAEVPSPRRVFMQKTSADVPVSHGDNETGASVLRHMRWLRTQLSTKEGVLRTLIRGVSEQEKEEVLLQLNNECFMLEKLVALMADTGKITEGKQRFGSSRITKKPLSRSVDLSLRLLPPTKQTSMGRRGSDRMDRSSDRSSRNSGSFSELSIDLGAALEQARAALPVQRIRVLRIDEELDCVWDLVRHKLVFDTCLAKHCVFLGKPHLLNELGHPQPYFTEHLERGARSILSVPIESNDPRQRSHTVVQFINRLKHGVGSEPCANGFSRTDELAAVRIGQHIRYISRMLRHEEKMAANKVQMQRFSEVAHAVCSQQDSNTLLEDVLQLLQKVLDAERVSLYLCDHARRDLFCIYSSEANRRGRLESYSEGIAGWVAEHERALNLRDAYRDPRFQPEWKPSQGSPMRSVLTVPVISKGKVVGVLQVINKIATTKEQCRLPALPEEVRMRMKEKGKESRVISQKLRLVRSHTQIRVKRAFSAETSSTGHFDNEEEKNGEAKPAEERQRSARECEKCSHGQTCGDESCPWSTTFDDVQAEVARTTSVTYFTDFDLKVCELVCARVTQALSSRAINFQYDKAIASSDSSSVLRSLLQDQTNREYDEKLLLEVEQYRTAFKAIGKFMRVVKDKRHRSKSRRWSVGGVDDGMQFMLEEQFQRILGSKPFPSSATFLALADVHHEVVGDNSAAAFGQWHFDVLDRSADDLVEDAATAMYGLGLCHKFNIERVKLHAFIEEISKRYLENPYHNWKHAAHVFQQVYAILLQTNASEGLHFHDVLALMIAALCHDVGHTGRTNDFECKSMSKLAVRYNDSSVLENYHAAVAFEVLVSEGTDMLCNVSQFKFREMRRLVINLILSTDMKNHARVLTDMSALVDQHPVRRLREEVQHRQTLADFLLHACDIGAQTAPPVIARRWADLVLLEFRAQAEDEARLNLALTPHMQNLDDPEVEAKVQKGFIDYIVEPTWQLMSAYFPEIDDSLLTNLRANRAGYAPPQS